MKKWLRRTSEYNLFLFLRKVKSIRRGEEWGRGNVQVIKDRNGKLMTNKQVRNRWRKYFNEPTFLGIIGKVS